MTQFGNTYLQPAPSPVPPVISGGSGMSRRGRLLRLLQTHARIVAAVLIVTLFVIPGGVALAWSRGALPFLTIDRIATTEPVSNNDGSTSVTESFTPCLLGVVCKPEPDKKTTTTTTKDGQTSVTTVTGEAAATPGAVPTTASPTSPVGTNPSTPPPTSGGGGSSTPVVKPPTTPTQPPVTTPPPASDSFYPFVASIQQNSGENWAAGCLRILSYGFNGCVKYLPGGTNPSWDATFRELASKAGNRRIAIQLTAKTHSNAGLEDVLKNLPAAWKKDFIYNIYQEPEDNLLDATSQANYRQSYSDAATVTRRYGASLPWVEWQQWTVDPTNNKGWNLANFTPPAGDFGGVLWSFFEYGEKERVQAQLDTVKAAMAKHAPGKPWALMAAGYTMEGSPITQAQQRAQLAWLDKSYYTLKAAGSKGYAWFNWNWPPGQSSSGEARLEVNSLTYDWMGRFR